MDENIALLRQKESEAAIKLRQYQDAIKALQLVCDHDWRYDGHGHNYDEYVCLNCGATEER